MDSALIFSIENPKYFGILYNGAYSFKFVWQSEIVIPKIFKITEHIYAIGIDLDFAVVAFGSKKILLDYFFYDTVINNEFIYVICELEIIKINQLSFIRIDKFMLIDFFKEIAFKEELIEIITTRGEIMIFNKVGFS